MIALLVMDGDSRAETRRHYGWTALWLALAAGTFALFAHRAWFIPGTDAEAYYRAGQRALEGTALYRDEATPFKYLPPVAALFIPFGFLPFQGAKMAFFLVSWGMGAWLYRAVIRRHGPAVALGLFAIFIRFHNYDFLNLQINHWVLLFFFLFLELRERRPWASALCLALTVFFKVTPLIVLFGMARARRGREVARFAACAGALLLIPTLLPGPGWRSYLDWYRLVQGTTPWPAPDFPIVQSVQSALWFALGNRLNPTAFFAAVQLLFALCLLLTLRKRPEGRDAESRLLAALAVLSVVFSPLAWKHHYLMVWPAVLALLAARQRLAAISAGIFMAAFPALIALFSREWADRSYVTVIGALVAWGALTFRPGTAGIKNLTSSADKPGV